jgi:hypothetical protein
MAQTLQARPAAQSAGAADVVTVAGAVSEVGGTDGQVQRASVTAPAGTTVTGAATNNATISVRVVRAGSVLATVATVTLASGVNISAEQPLALAVTPGTPLQKGDVLDVLYHQNASGLALPAGLVVDIETHFQAR